MNSLAMVEIGPGDATRTNETVGLVLVEPVPLRPGTRYEDDVWVLPPELRPGGLARSVRLDFTQVPPSLRELAKGYFQHLISRDFCHGYIAQTQGRLRPFFRFVGERYPTSTDLSELTVEDIDAFLLTLPSLRAGKLGRPRTLGVLRACVGAVSCLLKYLGVLPSLTVRRRLVERLPMSPLSVDADESVGLENDIWDMRTVPGMKLNPRTFRLNFSRIPASFRQAAKAYAIQLVKRPVGLVRQRQVVMALEYFLVCYSHNHPAAVDLTDVRVADMDEFVRFQSQPNTKAFRVTPEAVRARLADVVGFLEHLKAIGSPLVHPGLVPSHFRGRLSVFNGQRIVANEESTANLVLAGLVPGEAKTEAQLLTEDSWDVRAIPGVRWEDYWHGHDLHFASVPVAFRAATKKFMKWQLVSGKSFGTVKEHLISIRTFIESFLALHPAAAGFQELTMQDIDSFLAKLQAEPNRYGRPRTDRNRQHRLSAVEHFVRYLQRTGNPLAPRELCERLFVPGQVPVHYRPNGSQTVKFLPARVLEQLDEHIGELHPECLPIVLVLRASGWRISDVLMLRYDACLEVSGDGWWLVGDIHKTRVVGHKVPITKDIATVIQTQIAVAKERLPAALNPKRYLFPSMNARRRGKPIEAHFVQRALNRLGGQSEIRGDDGGLFHFKTHVFRHTKAVELINNGMPLSYVQKWMAHLSPEMTLVYARIQDNTMRRKWEEAMANGALKIDTNGQPAVIDPEEFVAEQELELEHVRAHLDATRVELGYCFKPRKMECPYAHTPCYSCPSFVTTPEFLPQFEHQERDTLVQIELGAAAGRAHWVEANRRKLTTLQPLIGVLREGKLHQRRSKAAREYTPREFAGQSAPAAESVA